MAPKITTVIKNIYERGKLNTFKHRMNFEFVHNLSRNILLTIYVEKDCVTLSIR